ncbi:hypothetical protein QQS21_012282 [Conoideocrella luteorostrata]|uniref:Uncharacterized protein n=1 Tax=Conoideocrella luteorostrata TaxID=1105319 RepID=A0AAJ0CBR8_9HYPO|nr:hypothetical protein QQS21_012282 [Conoideocrella luteorostrata]
MEEAHHDGRLGWGRRVETHFATPASRNINSYNSTPKTLDKTFIGRALARNSHTGSIHGSHEQGVLSRRHVFSEDLPMLGTSAIDGTSEGKPLAETAADQDALAMFDVYGIPRPEGLTLNRDRQSRGSQGKGTQLCHSCGEVLPYEQHCGRCGHDFCHKCASERLQGELVEPTRDFKHYGICQPSRIPDTRNIDKTPAAVLKADPRTPNRRPVTNNPFFLADRSLKEVSSAPQTTTNGRAMRPRRLSDCIPRRFRDRSPSNTSLQGQNNDQGEAKEDFGSSNAGHSLCCSAQAKGSAVEKHRRDGRLSETLQGKIDQLYRHAEDLHNAQNGVGYIATPFGQWGRKSDSATATVTTTSRRQSDMETPTRRPRASRLQSLEDDGGNVVASMPNARDMEQDASANIRSIRLRRLASNRFLKGSSNHSFSIKSSSSKGSLTKSPPDVQHSTNQHNVIHLQSVALSPKSKVRNSSGDPGRAHPGTSDKSLSDRADNDVANSLSALKQDHTVRENSPADLHTNSVRPDLPSLTGYRRHRQDTYLCARTQTPNSEPDPWPTLRRVKQPSRDKPPSTPNSVPRSRQALRKAPSIAETIQPESSCSTPPEWRQSMVRIEDTTQSLPPKIIPAETPLSEWRHNLTKPPPSAPKYSHKSIFCETCNPADLKKYTISNEGSERCRHKDDHSTHQDIHSSNIEDPFSEPRLSVRAIEHSLAWKRVQDGVKGDTSNDQEKMASPLKRDSILGEQKSASVPISPPSPHSCDWKERYLNLRNEIVSSQDMLGPYEHGSRLKGADAYVGYEGDPADELGIEGLTIIIHMKHKDDLVINTDLNGREYKGK